MVEWPGLWVLVVREGGEPGMNGRVEAARGKGPGCSYGKEPGGRSIGIT